MRGECRHHAVAGQRFIKNAITVPDYRLFRIDDYPGLVNVGAGQGVQVSGELWSVDDATLQRLDVIECVDDGLYERCPIKLETGSDGQQTVAEAWFYLPSVVGLEEIGADWREVGGRSD